MSRIITQIEEIMLTLMTGIGTVGKLIGRIFGTVRDHSRKATCLLSHLDPIQNSKYSHCHLSLKIIPEKPKVPVLGRGILDPWPNL